MVFHIAWVGDLGHREIFAMLQGDQKPGLKQNVAIESCDLVIEIEF